MIEISVITTVYNGINFIEENLESISNQKCDGVEHVVVDDGSTDDTLKFLKSYESKNLKIISNSRKGRGIALNEAIRNSSGKYVAILDADDVASVYRLLLQKKYLEKNPEYSVISSNCTVDRKALVNELPDSLNLTEIMPISFAKKNAICHSSALIRKDALMSVSCYSQERKELFDYDLWVRLLMNGHRFAKLESPLVYKRIHKQQSFERKNRLRYLYGSLLFKLEVLSKYRTSLFDYFYPFAVFLYGLIPNVIRRNLMDRLQ